MQVIKALESALHESAYRPRLLHKCVKYHPSIFHKHFQFTLPYGLQTFQSFQLLFSKALGCGRCIEVGDIPNILDISVDTLWSHNNLVARWGCCHWSKECKRYSLQNKLHIFNKDGSLQLPDSCICRRVFDGADMQLHFVTISHSLTWKKHGKISVSLMATIRSASIAHHPARNRRSSNMHAKMCWASVRRWLMKVVNPQLFRLHWTPQ